MTIDTIDRIVEDWYKRTAPVMTERTIATNRAPVEYLTAFFRGKTPKEIDQPGMEWLRNTLLKEGKSKITVARYLSTLRAACNGYLNHLDIGKMISELNRGGTEIEIWTLEESRLLIEVASGIGTLRPELTFLFGTGARRGEMLALQGKDLDFERNRIHIRRSLTLSGEIQNGTKWGGSRWVPMSAGVRSVLSLSLDGDGGVSTVFGGRTQESFRRAFERIRTISGVPPLKLHCTRHTAISRALSAGMSLRKASEIFGVSQQTLEKHYAHWIDDGEIDMAWADA